MTETVAKPWIPSNKVVAGGLFIQASAFLTWGAKQFLGFDLPAEHALFLVGLAVTALQYAVKDRG